MCARVHVPVHVLVPPPRIRIPTRTHTKYSNVTQTLPHGSRCHSVARIRKRGDTPKVGYSIDADVDSKYADAHENACPPEQNDTEADASPNCADTEVGKLRIVTPAKASALH